MILADYDCIADKRLPVSNMTAICGMISWTAILYTSLRWHKGLKVQGIDRNTLPYKAPSQPYLSYCEYEVYSLS
jgi:amino acid permease